MRFLAVQRYSDLSKKRLKTIENGFLLDFIKKTYEKHCCYKNNSYLCTRNKGTSCNTYWDMV